MANIEQEVRKDGSVIYRVRWIVGGSRGGKRASEPFEGADADKRAERFKLDVELAKHQWPANYIPRVGYVTAEEFTALRAASDASGGTAGALMAYASDYVDRLTGIQASTRAGYHRLLANYVRPFPALAAADVVDVTEDIVSDWVNWLERGEQDTSVQSGIAWLRAPLAPKTVANAHGLLFAIFAKACRGEKPLRRTNPCADTRLPRLDDSTGEEMVFLTPGEFAILWRSADARAQDALVIAVGTGARFGEFTAFQAVDVNLGSGDDLPFIQVDRAWHRQSEARPLLGPPKSKKSRRSITLDPVTAGVIAPLVEGRAPGDFLLTDAHGEPLRHGTWYGPLWQPTVYRAVRCPEHRARDKADGIVINGETVRLTSRRQLTMRWIVPCGCPGTLRKVPRTHDLRHTAVAWLIAAEKNIPMSSIAGRLGHESVLTTDKTYGHLLPELEGRQAGAMNAALSPLNITSSGFAGAPGRVMRLVA